MSTESLTTVLQETLTLFESDGEPLTTTEVADSLDIGRRSTYERLERLVETGYLETKKVGASARVWWLSSTAAPAEERAANRSTTTQDVRAEAERLQRERDELESELDQVFDRVSDGFYVLDEELRIRYLNEHAMKTLGLDASAIGQYFLETVTVTESFEKALSDALESQDPVVMEDYYDPVERWYSNAIYPSENGLSVYFRNITDRKKRELQLERYAGIVNAVGEPVYELDMEGRFTFVNQPFVETCGYSEEELLGEHVSIGMSDDAVARAESKILSLLSDDASGTTTLEYEAITKGGERISVENRLSLVTDDNGRVRGFAGVVRDISGRKEREWELERQREQVVALNHLNETVREITDIVLEESTHEGIEQAACEALVDSDSYTFAWVAGVDPGTQQITPRIEVGVDGYLEDIELSADPEEAVGQGPAGRAIRNAEMQVSQNVFEDSSFEPWWEYAEEYGYRSVAAIPITHEETLYGLLGLYTERPGAFEKAERSVVGQVGEIIGHAFAAADRKQALMSDEVVELQFRIRDIFEAFDLDVPASGTVFIDHTIHLEDDEFLHYGTVTPDGRETVELLVDSVPEWLSARFWDEDDETIFELRVSEPPVLSKVAALGGSIEQALIEDGDYLSIIHVAPSADIQQIIETFRSNYPTVELVKRKQTTRSPTSVEITHTDVESRLTDSQRTVLETAVYAGYFEWPREAAGEDVAESLEIAPSTFSQHLRKAQKNVFGSLYPRNPDNENGDASS